MENQNYLNRNFSMANHLPQILNMMHILNMMVYGFVASQPAYFISAITSLQKSIQFSPERLFGKRLHFSVHNLNYVTLTASVLLVLVANNTTVNLLFIISSMALFCPGIQSCTTNKLTPFIGRMFHLPGKINWHHQLIEMQARIKLMVWCFLRQKDPGMYEINAVI